MKRPIAILGAGNMASALALNLARHGRPVRLYCIEADVEEEIRRNRTNSKYLAGHHFPKNVSASNDLVGVVDGADAVFVVVPSFAVSNVLTQARPHLAKDAIIASVSKGLDPKTLEPIVESESRLLPPALRRRICALGGPAIATEMAKGSPTGIVIASKDRRGAETIKLLLSSASVKVTTSQDVRGVGLASALKNAYAISLGLCDGLKLPMNAKALVLTIALEELSTLLKACGADKKTAYGLAGLGDFAVSGFSSHGRNRTYGEHLVGAKTKDPKAFGLMTVEGIVATALALRLARKTKAIKALPLLAAIDRCLRARKDYAEPFIGYLKHLTLA